MRGLIDNSVSVDSNILGLSYASAGDKFEVPNTMGEQWAYRPGDDYKDAATVLRILVGIVSKGGNYLLNIGLDAKGVWAPAALETLANLTKWFGYNAESIHNTTTQWPYAYQGLFFTQSLAHDSSYILW
eukprot:Hpha_TRINITY_DN24782_c0_g1::TRINITY_DN24782_c0_g1_i1::g.110264::m.110264